MFIKSLTINNYRCFGDNSDPITFNTPNGNTKGSGLNILVGENGTGKTTILESVSYLTESPYFLGNKFSIQDFADSDKPILIEASVNKKFKYKLPETFRGSYVNANGFKVEIKARENPSPGKLLSPHLQVKGVVTTEDDKATTKSGGESSAILDDYTLALDSNRIGNINIFYFDRFRTRHIATRSTYNTTFDRVIDDLNWKFLKTVRESTDTEDNLKEKFSNEFFQAIINTAQQGVGSKGAKEVKKFFERDEFEKIRIDFMNLLWPFENAFFALRGEESLTQIPVNKLGAGIELVFSLLFLKAISSVSKGSIVYLIDEPETSLHPQAQKKLFKLLVEESKDNQVVVSTHSSYFAEPSFINNIARFKKTDKSRIYFNKLENDKLSHQLKENRNFFFRHRDLFFTDRAIFLEGVDDYDRYLKFCEKNGFENLLSYFYIMNGCDQTLFFESFCNKFGIDFFAIVDKDFSFRRSKWARANRRRFIKDIKKFINKNGIQFDTQRFNSLIKKELQEKPRQDERETETVEVIVEKSSVKIWRVKNKNIYVLKKGEVKDYLKKDGEITTEEKGEKLNELKAIFTDINVNFRNNHV